MKPKERRQRVVRYAPGAGERVKARVGLLELTKQLASWFRVSSGYSPMRVLALSAKAKRNLVSGSGSRVLAVCLLQLLALEPCLASEQSTPDALIKSLYHFYVGPAASGFPLDDDRSVARYFAPRLARLVISYHHRVQAEGGAFGCLDYDPIANAQEFEIRKVSISGGSDASSGRAEMVARFLNFDSPVEVRFSTILTASGWKVADIRTRWSPSLQSDLKRCLSATPVAAEELRYLPYAVNEAREWFLPGWVWTQEFDSRTQCSTEEPLPGLSYGKVLCIPGNVASTHHLLDIPPEMKRAWDEERGPAPQLSGKFAPPDIPWLLAHGAFWARANHN